MKARPLILVLWLWFLVPSVAHAGSFALALYPCGVLISIFVTSVLLARDRGLSIRVTSAIVATLTSTGIFLLPVAFYSANPFQYLESWIGEWAFFVLGLVPASIMALLVLRLGAHAPYPMMLSHSFKSKLPHVAVS